MPGKPPQKLSTRRPQAGAPQPRLADTPPGPHLSGLCSRRGRREKRKEALQLQGCSDAEEV